MVKRSGSEFRILKRIHDNFNRKPIVSQHVMIHEAKKDPSALPMK